MLAKKKPTVVVIINCRYEKGDAATVEKLLIRKLYTVLLLLLLAAPPDEILKNCSVVCVSGGMRNMERSSPG